MCNTRDIRETRVLNGRLKGKCTPSRNSQSQGGCCFYDCKVVLIQRGCINATLSQIPKSNSHARPPHPLRSVGRGMEWGGGVGAGFRKVAKLCKEKH